jgi:N-acetylneuraminic acid mutarotase
MRIRTLFTTCILLSTLFLTENLYAQGWIKRANAPRTLAFPSAAGVAGKIYLTGAYDVELYEYDPLTQHWTTKSRMPAACARFSAAAANLNNMLYAGLGICDNNRSSSNPLHKNFFLYDPPSDTWSQKADFPGYPRWVTAYFTINNKFYVTYGTPATGANPPMVGTNPPTPGCIDTWEYDPTTNTWTQKADFPGGPKDYPVGFSVGNKGYLVGGGYNGTDLWEYDPTTNLWSKKASCPNNDQGGTAFTLNLDAYFLTSGIHLPSKLLKYTPATNSWTQLPDFPGPIRNGSISAVVGNSAFVTGGLQANGPNLNDHWEYNLNCQANIINDLSIDSYKASYCADTLNVDTIKAFTVNDISTIYTWLKSTNDTSYSIIGNSNKPYLANERITQTTYYKRVAYLGPQCFDTSTALPVVIDYFKPARIDTITPPHVCTGDTAVMEYISPNTGVSWFKNGVYITSGPTFKAVTPGFYHIEVSAFSNSCEGISDSVEVVINPLPQPTINISGDTLKSSIAASSYQWFEAGVAIPSANADDYIPQRTGNYSLAVVDVNGCTGQTQTTFFEPSSVTHTDFAKLSIFPNPATNFITVTYTGSQPTQLIIGNIVTGSKTELSIQQGNTTFNTDEFHLFSGTYMASYTLDGVVYHLRFVIL